MVKLLAESAPAKINLFLRVVGRRPDGYHLLDSIFVPISLCDRVRIELRPARAASVSLTCDREGLPRGERNLAWRAASAFMAEFGVAAEALIDLRKTIPVGAGLGGGSSDAGAVLRMMAALFRVADADRLVRLALGLGADVPFFLAPAPARVGGIGERIAPLPSFPKLELVIAVPPVEVSTAAVFGAVRQDEWSGPGSDGDVRAIAAGELTPARLVNDLAPAATRLFPQIGRLKAILEDLGATAAAMTGSGGAVFGIFRDAASAERAAGAARRRAPDCQFIAASSLDRVPALHSD